jgi:hypothetical protein
VASGIFDDALVGIDGTSDPAARGNRCILSGAAANAADVCSGVPFDAGTNLAGVGPPLPSSNTASWPSTWT